MRIVAPGAHAASVDLEEKVEFLSTPGHYPVQPSVVDTIETHFAWIFLAGEWVYKIKKPLHQPLMDYRTVHLRERACRMELQLNRRLAPDVYRKVVALWHTRAGGLSLHAGAGGVVDWLVKMRRIPVHRMLDRAICDGTVHAGDLERVIGLLARFFHRADSLPMSDQAYRSRLCRQIRQVGRELHAPDLTLPASGVSRVIGMQLEWLASYRHLLVGRGQCLRNGHGDLRPEHIFLGTKQRSACVIDCLEFDARLRRLDPADEMAFVALECTRLGAEPVAENLLALYRTAMNDPVPRALSAFYMSRNAVVRAQIAAWHLRDPQFAAQSLQWRRRSVSYIEDAIRHVRCARELARSMAPSVPGRASRGCQD